MATSPSIYSNLNKILNSYNTVLKIKTTDKRQINVTETSEDVERRTRDV